MCYILKSVFCQTPEGQFEFKGMDQWLLGCSENPPKACHFNHPASFLNTEAHRFILTRIGNDTTVPKFLHPLQEQARNLLKNEDARIQDLQNTTFIFFPRWMENGVLCRQLGLNGDEIIMRLDGSMQAGCPPLTIDAEGLCAPKVDSSNSSSFGSTRFTKTSSTAPTKSFKNSTDRVSKRHQKKLPTVKRRFT